MKLLEIPNQEEEIKTLARASYEVQCRQNIINFMVKDGMTENSNYKKYWDEYILYSMAYDKLKNDFQNRCIIPNVKKNFQGNWEVDFNTGEIKIYD